jgi:hypothetical protein
MKKAMRKIKKATDVLRMTKMYHMNKLLLKIIVAKEENKFLKEQFDKFDLANQS